MKDNRWLTLLILATVAAGSCSQSSAGTIPIYALTNAPAVPDISGLAVLDRLSKDGITWTFSREVPVGQFITGDYYVVGPVTITAIDPAPANGRNGSVVNLPGCREPNTSKTGFDDRTSGNRYDAKLRAALPIDLAPGDSLVSSISVETVGSIKRVFRTSNATVSPVQSVSILTCLPEPVAPDAFRPSYCDVSNVRLYYSRNLQRELLPHLPKVRNTPAIAPFEGYLRRPWLDTLFFGFDAPVEYMPDYGREVARVLSHASLLLCLDFPAEEKETLLVYLVQYGIDLFGATEAGHRGWPAHGGHGVGRKLPILLAGRLLGEPEMLAVSANFSEDLQTLIADSAPLGPGWTGATALFAGHAGITGDSVHAGWGPYEHLQPRDWVDTIGERYRRCCTSVAFVGEALAARLLGLERPWNHPAFFAYTERWMTEDDSVAVAEIKSQIGLDLSAAFQRQGQAWDDFVEQMWAAHWPAAGGPTPPTGLRRVESPP